MGIQGIHISRGLVDAIRISAWTQQIEIHKELQRTGIDGDLIAGGTVKIPFISIILPGNHIIQFLVIVDIPSD